MTTGRPATLALAGGTAGFTLLEILVVLVLLGLLTGVAAARFSTLRQTSLAEAGRDVILELRAYRSQAEPGGGGAGGDFGAAALPQQSHADRQAGADRRLGRAPPGRLRAERR